jgi:DNA topoisomerase-1
LKRIRSLAIPPAWTAVWICPYPNGHIQAVGRDQRGRKQYRYHSRWREVRDESKYGKMLIFGRVLPAIRKRVEADLRRRGLPRERVLAAVVRLMEATLFRIGNTEYAKANKSYGLTTLRDRHVEIDGNHIHLSFRGKHGIRHESEINDRRLARIITGDLTRDIGRAWGSHALRLRGPRAACRQTRAASDVILSHHPAPIVRPYARLWWPPAAAPSSHWTTARSI